MDSDSEGDVSIVLVIIYHRAYCMIPGHMGEKSICFRFIGAYNYLK